MSKRSGGCACFCFVGGCGELRGFCGDFARYGGNMRHVILAILKGTHEIKFEKHVRIRFEMDSHAFVIW